MTGSNEELRARHLKVLGDFASAYSADSENGQALRAAIAALAPATVSVEAVLALVALWRNRAARKRECGLTKEAEIDEARADELESLTRGEK